MPSLLPQHFFKFLPCYAAVFQDSKEYATGQFLSHMYRDGGESHLALVNAAQLRMRAALPLTFIPSLARSLTSSNGFTLGSAPIKIRTRHPQIKFKREGLLFRKFHFSHGIQSECESLLEISKRLLSRLSISGYVQNIASDKNVFALFPDAHFDSLSVSHIYTFPYFRCTPFKLWYLR